jgi:hypothetical protein
VRYGVSGSHICHGQRPLHCMHGLLPLRSPLHPAVSSAGGAGGGASGSSAWLLFGVHLLTLLPLLLCLDASARSY